jgi:hypothetical protein
VFHFFILIFILFGGNPYSHANSECYIFNSTPAFFFIYHLSWLHGVIDHLSVSFTTPSPSTCVSKGSGRISGAWVSDAEKEVSGDSAWLILSLDGCTLWWLWLSFHLSYIRKVFVLSHLWHHVEQRGDRSAWRRQKPLQRMYIIPFGPLQFCYLRFLSPCTNSLTCHLSLP